MKCHVWTDAVTYLAVAHASTVEDARNLLLENTDLGKAGDGSCPLRDYARKEILRKTPAIYTGPFADFVLSDSAELREQKIEIERLEKQLSWCRVALATILRLARVMHRHEDIAALAQAALNGPPASHQEPDLFVAMRAAAEAYGASKAPAMPVALPTKEENQNG